MGAELSSPLGAAIRPRVANALTEKLGLQTVGDLLRYYPRKYLELGRVTDLTELVEGEHATVQAKVVKADVRRIGGGRSGGVKNVTKLLISDGRNELELSFFNQPHKVQQFPVGTVAMFSGKVTRFGRTLQIASPLAEKLQGAGERGDALKESLESFASGLIPVYPLVQGLTQVLLQRAVHQALDCVQIVDPVPEVLLSKYGYTELPTALRDVHRPPSATALQHAQHRLRYDEAMSVQLVLARRRFEARQFPAEPCPRIDGGLLEVFDTRLPFDLTDGQRAVGETIEVDLATIHPMNRLLQGEVGSGKTVVALRAMLQVIDSGRQAVLLAPTEVLAAQHARSLRTILGELGRGGELGAQPEATKIILLTGSMPAAARRHALLDITSGQAGITVGTHALLSDDVFFANLGLVVVDEQHRFGVEQRDTLRTRHPAGNPPHVLVMTATPIPRTVAMTVYGDLDTSLLSELPRGRVPITTTVVPAREKPQWMQRAWDRIREEVAKGHQAYVVCPKIGDDAARDERRDPDALDTRGGDVEDEDWRDFWRTAGARKAPVSVLDIAETLRTGPLADLRLGVLHGRLPSIEKDAVMTAFTRGELDVLVATTVIEVGVDVPNASMMVILDADRFGMSQLHQLRGRVGRGLAPGVCLLVTLAYEGTISRRRLDAVAGTIDGFAIAEADLSLRREGDVLGTSQAGNTSGLRQLSLLRDRDVIEEARADARTLVDDDPTLQTWPGLAALARSVITAEEGQFLEKS